jgi:hypothetical protein
MITSLAPEYRFDLRRNEERDVAAAAPSAGSQPKQATCRYHKGLPPRHTPHNPNSKLPIFVIGSMNDLLRICCAALSGARNLRVLAASAEPAAGTDQRLPQ